MGLGPKTKRNLALVGGTVLLVACMAMVSKCTRDCGERDAVSIEAARADSLQSELALIKKECAAAREKAMLNDSIVGLNDSIRHLVEANDSLREQLDVCRESKKAAKPVPRRKNKKVVAAKAKTQVAPVATPVQANTTTAPTTVNVNGGCGNTVNVNNGTINNYYAPTVANDSVRIRVKKTVTTNYVIRVTHSKCL